MAVGGVSAEFGLPVPCRRPRNGQPFHAPALAQTSLVHSRRVQAHVEALTSHHCRGVAGLTAVARPGAFWCFGEIARDDNASGGLCGVDTLVQGANAPRVAGIYMRFLVPIGTRPRQTWRPCSRPFPWVTGRPGPVRSVFVEL